jgi:putative hydrolase of the HAD superfamily
VSTDRLAAGVVMWDFDGTLARRPGLWSGCVLELLDEHLPGHGVTREAFRERMRGHYPWNRHETPHPELSDADAWWTAMRARLAAALTACGLERAHADELAHAVRDRFVDAGRGWELFADTRAALARTATAGWRNVILSNHVPELGAIADALGLAPLVERVFSSGVTGYEKPHPRAFEIALEACGEPRAAWMVGDNPLADVAGAEALGIPAVLVRGSGQAERHAPDVAGAAALILTETAG